MDGIASRARLSPAARDALSALSRSLAQDLPGALVRHVVHMHRSSPLSLRKLRAVSDPHLSAMILLIGREIMRRDKRAIGALAVRTTSSEPADAVDREEAIAFSSPSPAGAASGASDSVQEEARMQSPQPASKPAGHDPVPTPQSPSGAALQASRLPQVVRSVSLRNATVGRPYDMPVAIPDRTPGHDVEIRSPADLGLAFDREAGAIRGIPVVAGEHPVQIRTVIGPSPGAQTLILNGKLIVNPDPKSLWKDIPSDPAGPFAKPDEASARLIGPSYVMAAASKRGRSHANQGQFRDDDFHLECADGGWQVAIVADGAGSAKFSRQGSRVAVAAGAAAIVAALARHADARFEAALRDHGDKGNDKIVRDILYQILAGGAFAGTKAIGAAAATLGVEKDYATTFIAVIARRYVFGHFFAGFGIGDGGAGVLDAEAGNAWPLTMPDGGEFAGQTRFLAPGEFQDATRLMSRIRYKVVDRYSACLLMTDGITDPKFDTDANFAAPQRWQDFWTTDLAASVQCTRENPTLDRDLLQWLDFWSPGNHDDRTIAVVLP